LTNQWHWFHPDPKISGSLPYDHLTSLLPDPKEPEHFLWVGTGGGGLVRLDLLNETFTEYTVEDGLPNNFIYGVLGDDSGKLWMSTNHGLSCYDPSTHQFKNYDLSHGLQSNEFNTRSYYRNNDGKMLFGGINGITSFYPDRIIPNPHLPQVVLTGLQLSYEPVTQGKSDSPLEYSITETKQIHAGWVR
jgi:ligand-binding sensor domain-containing protein